MPKLVPFFIVLADDMLAISSRWGNCECCTRFHTTRTNGQKEGKKSVYNRFAYALEPLHTNKNASSSKAVV